MSAKEIFAIIATLVTIGYVSYMLIKKYDARIALFTGGLVLLIIAGLLGNLDTMKNGTGIGILNAFAMVTSTFVTYISGAGIIIMLLFGYSTYMSKIGANDVTVEILTKPLLKVKSPYILAALIFLVGNLLSLVVPSASSLAIILMATLYPVLKKSGMTSLTAAAIIATAASIMPTPLGADTVQVAAALKMNVMLYTYGKHALVSIPGILVMALAHYFWQKHMDKSTANKTEVDVEVEKLSGIRNDLPPKIYGILPILPILLLLLSFILQEGLKLKVSLSVEVVTVVSFIAAIIFEMIRSKSVRNSLTDMNEFFKGMGAGFTQVVTLVVSATLLINGIQAIGIVDMLTKAAKGVNGAGVIILFVFVFFILLIGLLSGSGNSALYALIALVPTLAVAAKVPGYMITVPMQMASNLVRGLSPVAAVIVIVAGMIKTNPVNVIKRTAVPALVTMVFTIVLSIILFSVVGL